MRMISSFLLVSVLTLPLAACGGSDPVDADPYPTLEDCFTDHVTEGLTVPHAITTCCLDHPIGGMAAGAFCGATEAACETAVDDALADADATGGDITAACTDYINQR